VIRYVEHLDGQHGPAVFSVGCRRGLEGIVSKRLQQPVSLGPVRGVAEGEEPGLGAPMMAKWTVPFRVSGWACVALIAYLSLAPHEMQVMTGLPEFMEDFVPAGMEHIIAYAGTAFFLRLGYPRQSFWRISLALFIYSAGLELLQALSPGRHPGLDGALQSGMGTLLGAGLADYALRRMGA
jgi:hypothetical protein